jgi:hypothetical protein
MYSIDPATGDLIINGFEKGIGDSPYSGLTDLKNVNLSSVTGEASVNFKTATKTPPKLTGSVTSVSNNGGNVLIISNTTTNLEIGMCVYFTSLSSGSTGVVNSTPYWVNFINGLTFGVTTDYERNNNAYYGSGTATGTWTTYNIATPKYVIQQGNEIYYTSNTPVNWMIDSSGQVWSNKKTTTSGYWTFTGNTNVTGANGNGLVYYPTSDTTKGYIFAFRGAVIDYTLVNPYDPPSVAVSWQYGWSPTSGTTGNITGLKSTAGSGNSHESWLMPDGRIYFCDGPNVGKFYQTDLSGTTFDPANISSYTYSTFPLLPLSDLAQCLAPSGTNVLIGGAGNVIYTWNTTSNQISYPILLPESNVVKMITVNTNTYAFVGNRGRIYITNGAQANLFKKVPDHLSYTVEPYFTWGGVCNLRNHLYFGISATDNAGNRIPNYGGVWGLDIDSKALRLANELSYGGNAGNATALFGQGNPSSFALGGAYPSSNPLGSGLIIGWDNTYYGSVNGIDASSGSLYSGGQSIIISDMIPIGTKLNPTTSSQLEFKLAAPLLAGEIVELQVAQTLTSGTSPTFTSALIVNGDGSLISGNSEKFPIEKNQWLLVKAILTGGTSATPTSNSFNRLTEIRIIGGTQSYSAQKQSYVVS